jgi:hypothetical protein
MSPPSTPERRFWTRPFGQLVRQHAVAVPVMAGLVAAWGAYQRTAAPAAAVRLGVATALAGVAVMGLLLLGGRALGLRTNVEWAHEATPRQHREHRVATMLGALIVAGVVVWLLYY